MTDDDASTDVDREDQCGEITIDFRIRGDALEPAAITSSLGIGPTLAFAKGDPSTSGGRAVRRATGIWSLQSNSYVDSDLAAPHAQFLLDVLEPKRDFLTRYVRDADYRVGLSVCWKSDTASGFSLPSDILARLCAFCNTFTVTFCPEPP
jgi:hypothetical protein